MDHNDLAKSELPWTPEEITLWKMEMIDYTGYFLRDVLPESDCGRVRELEVFRWIRHFQSNFPELCEICKISQDHPCNREKLCTVTLAGIYVGDVSFVRILTKNDVSENDREISELARLINFYAK